MYNVITIIVAVSIFCGAMGLNAYFAADQVPSNTFTANLKYVSDYTVFVPGFAGAVVGHLYLPVGKLTMPSWSPWVLLALGVLLVIAEVLVFWKTRIWFTQYAHPVTWVLLFFSLGGILWNTGGGRILN